MTTFATETWPGAANAAWPTQWLAGTTDNGGSAKQSGSGTGTLAQTTTGYKTVREYLGSTNQVDQELYVEFYVPSITLEYYIDIGVRNVRDTTNYYYTGYGITISPNSGGWSQNAAYGTGQYGTQSVTRTFVAAHWYAARVGVFGSGSTGPTSRSRVWDLTAGEAEPTTWQATFTDDTSGAQSGVPSLGMHSGSSQTASPQFRNLKWTDGASTVLGTLGLSGSGTLANAGTPKPAATQSLGGTGSLAGTGTPSTAGSAPTGGTGLLSGAGSPTVSGSSATSGTGNLATSAIPNVQSAMGRTGSGSLALSGSGSYASSTATSGSGTLAPVGTPNTTGSSTGSGIGSLALSGIPTLTGVVSTSGTGSVTSAGSPGTSGELDTAGNGTLTLTALGNGAGSLGTSGSGSLAVSGTASITGALTTSGTGSLTLVGTATIAGATSLAGAGTLALASQTTPGATLALSGTGALTLVAMPTVVGAIALSGDGRLTLTPPTIVVGNVALSASGALTLVGHAQEDSDYEILTAAIQPRHYAASVFGGGTTAAVGTRRWNADVIS